MNIDDMTYRDLKAIAAIFGTAMPQPETFAEPIPVVVWTDKRGVIFGYTSAPRARPIVRTRRTAWPAGETMQSAMLTT